MQSLRWQTIGWKIVGHNACLFQCHPHNVIYQTATTADDLSLTLQATMALWRMIEGRTLC